MSNLQGNHRGMLLMGAFAVLFAVVDVLEALVLGRYTVWQVVWTRFAVHASLMLLIWGWRDPSRLWRTQRVGFQLARCAVLLGMPAAWVFGSEQGVDASTFMAVFWVSPLLILAFARFALGERVGFAGWVAAVAAFAGATLLHAPGKQDALHLLAFPLAMAVCFATYVAMTRSLRRDGAQTNLFLPALGVVVLLAPVMPHVWVTPAPGDFAVMLAVGIVGYGCLYSLDRMANAAPISVTAPFAYLQVPLAAIAAFIAAGGIHHPRRAALGMLLVVGAAIFLWWREPGRQALPTGTRTRAR